ncbi:MAG TPA: TolC family protein [Cyclobacteriaceae bacterium]|nr:TolC family protein [Cyclobacteriaceae bacterium]
MTFHSVCTVSAFLTLAGLYSCKISEPATSAIAPPMPDSFQRKRPDTTLEAARIPWNDFFDDPDLIALIDTAIKKNLDLKMAMQRIEMASAHARVSKGARLPSLSAVTSAAQRKFGEYTMDGIGNFDTNFSNNVGDDKHIAERLPDYYVGLQSAWEVDLWGKLRNQKRASVARFLASEKGKHLIMTSLVAAVAHYYYELLTLDNELEIIRQNIRLQETAVNLVNAQKLAGRANQLAVKQFGAQLLNTKSLEAQVNQEIVQNENQLNVLLGRFPQPIGRGNPILKQKLPKEINAGIPSQMLIRRPDIQQAELELVAGNANVLAARAAFFPSLMLSSSLGFQAFNTAVLFNPGSMAYSVLAGLSAPLFNRNMVKANYKQASAERLEVFFHYQKTVLTGFQEVVTGLKRIENLEVVSDLKEEEVGALQEAVAASKDLFIAGMASYLEVVMAQKSVLEAELELSVTRKEQFFSVIDLYKAVGGGWE